MGKLSSNGILFYLLVLLLATSLGCAPAFYCGLEKESNRAVQKNEIKPIFDKSVNAYLFKTKIWVFGKYFSGIMAFKQMEGDSYRAIFMSEMGLKLFDFEFFSTDDESENFKIHHCIEVFRQKEALLKIIENDIRLLLVDQLPETAKVFERKKTELPVFRYKDDKRKSYYFVDENAYLTRIENTGNLFKKVIVSLSDYKDNFPESILFTHKGIKIKIAFSRIKR